MTTIDTSSFEKTRTPDELKAILDEHAEYFDVADSMDRLIFLDGDTDAFVDALFRNALKNEDVYVLLKDRAESLMVIADTVQRSLLLWRGRYEFGGKAELVERRGKPTIGVMAIAGGKVTVLNDFDRITKSVANGDRKKQARRLLRRLIG